MKFASGVVLIVWSLVLVTCANAVDLYSTNFEDPPFVNGSQLQGQDGWVSADDLPPFLNPSAAKITNADAASGSQSVSVSGADLTSAVEVDPYSAVGSFRHPVNYDTNATGQKMVRLSADFKVTGPDSVAYSLFAGSLAARDNAGFTLGELEIGPNGSLGGFGDQDPGSDPLVSGSVTPGEWHNLAIEVDYNTDQTTFFVDGSQLGDPISFAALTPSGVLARGALVAYASPDVADQFSRANHSVYFDNFSISAVPEPASSGLLVLGLFGLLGRWRRKR
jgi:hypothetical protein